MKQGKILTPEQNKNKMQPSIKKTNGQRLEKTKIDKFT